MSFLDRFQGKIATVTAQGHLRKADGSEEIRVGPPKRKPQPRASAPVKEKTPTTNNNNAGNNSGGRRPEAEPNVSPKLVKSGRDHNGNEGYAENNNNSAYRDDGDRRVQSGEHHRYGQATMPGQLSDDHYYDSPGRNAPASKSPSPTQDRGRELARDRSSPRVPAAPARSQQVEQQSEASRGNRSPKDINEARVRSEHDQLAFSRKARPVSYEPCKLSQYKKEKPGGYYELDKLQPDLNSDELVQKRANMERIKAFSKNLRDINKVTTSATKKAGENNESGSPKKPKSTRDKALEFAKRVPKPKAHRALAPEDDEAAPQQTATSAPEPKAQASARLATNVRGIAQKVPRPINSVIDDDSEDDELSSELLQLQQRHQQSRAQVDAIIGGG